jgi:2-oxoglutarate dehydrogenase E1 component
MSLVPNPSHLETVDPVVLGKVRANQDQFRDDLDKHEQVLPVLLHGDAAFAGQGIVWECFGFSGAKGIIPAAASTFIINNQIGFTTSPQFARSPYPSDVAKGVQAPIFHVNGDDPEAVTFACKLAIEFRQKFHRDIVIDMWCYRRFGHNEGDEPSFTQPLMYKAIRKHPAVSEVYAARLAQEGVIDDGLCRTCDPPSPIIWKEFEAAKTTRPIKPTGSAVAGPGLQQPADPETARRNVETGDREESCSTAWPHADDVPEGLRCPQDAGRVIEAKAQMFKTARASTGRPAKRWRSVAAVRRLWRPPVRAGFGRGTFSQRHAVWVDQTDEQPLYPAFDHAAWQVRGAMTARCPNIGVLGFEYGYAMADPKTLVLWEGAVRRFRQRRADHDRPVHRRRRIKWLRANGLVMLLPHGYEGQGPEHSSARLERFLQLCAEDNIQVANCTTPANYFHALRRQMHARSASR